MKEKEEVIKGIENFQCLNQFSVELYSLCSLLKAELGLKIYELAKKSMSLKEM